MQAISLISTAFRRVANRLLSRNINNFQYSEVNKMIKFLLPLVAFSVTLSLISAQQSSCLSENDIAVEPKLTVGDLYRGQQEFSVAMLDAIQKATPNENVFFSPYSTYHALLLAYFGARGETEKELINTLRLNWAKSKSHVAGSYKFEKQRRALRSKDMPLEFASADKIYFDKSIKLSPCMTDLFFEELESKNFHEDAEQCRKDINGWIANITRNEIPEMLGAGDVTTETQLLLANAAYLKGKWANQFDPKDTTMEIFYTKNNSSFVQMMHKRGTYNLGVDENLGAYVLEMPYQTSKDEDKESEISMVIILPPRGDDSLENVLKKLTPDSLEMTFKESMAREVDVSLPKFEFEQNLELLPILREMGVNLIFDQKADLSAFSAESQLVFGDAKHVSKIKVDEEGSTAASATVLFSFRSARPVEPTEFKCNHPFLFLIFDHKSKAVLFTGIYRDPKLQN